MNVEIWSDVVCPFCYIGKRNLELALQEFDHRDKVVINWRSFELNPGVETDPSINAIQRLAQLKGWSEAYARQLVDQVGQSAREVGLEFDYESAIIANTIKAHRLTHLATRHELQNKAEEQLFAAHFTEGKNIDDDETIIQLGCQIGLPEQEIRGMLQSDQFTDQVQEDIARARQLGIGGVPFFVLNNQYAVSGAQPVATFRQALEQAYDEIYDGR